MLGILTSLQPTLSPSRKWLYEISSAYTVERVCQGFSPCSLIMMCLSIIICDYTLNLSKGQLKTPFIKEKYRWNTYLC